MLDISPYWRAKRRVVGDRGADPQDVYILGGGENVLVRFACFDTCCGCDLESRKNTPTPSKTRSFKATNLSS